MPLPQRSHNYRLLLIGVGSTALVLVLAFTFLPQQSRPTPSSQPTVIATLPPATSQPMASAQVVNLDQSSVVAGDQGAATTVSPANPDRLAPTATAAVIKPTSQVATTVTSSLRNPAVPTSTALATGTPTTAARAGSIEQATVVAAGLGSRDPANSPGASSGVPGSVIYQADFDQIDQFQPTTIGEGDVQLVAKDKVLTCVPPTGSLGDGELWLIPSQAVPLRADGHYRVQARLRSRGSLIGLAFDQAASGAAVIKLTGTRTATYVAVDQWQGHSRYYGDGQWATPQAATKLELPFADTWHDLTLELDAGSYHLSVDGQAAGSGGRNGSGTVALYAACDEASFSQLTISQQ